MNALSPAPRQEDISTPVLAVENLSISYRENDRTQTVVHDVGFTIGRSEVVALVGESGSGKTTTAQAIIGLLADNGRIESGAVRLGGVDIAHWSDARLRTIRGARISLVPQDPSSSLNPVKTIGAQVGEVLAIHGHRDRKANERTVLTLLEKVGLPDPALRARQYPHELSGGMKQRVLIAIAIALEPDLIIADEPTSALDVTVQKRILDLLDDLRREIGTAVLFVTHDLGVAADRADSIVVLRHGAVEEAGPTRQILAAPANPYTRRLLADAPSFHSGPANRQPVAADRPALVDVKDLVCDFTRPGTRERFRAVDGVSFTVPEGTTHAIVGESGSGKTTTARALVGFQRPTGGGITIDGVDLLSLKGEPLRQFRRNIQMVYQNPFGSIDPQQSIFSVVEEPLLNYGRIDRSERARRVHALIDRVGLPQSAAGRTARALSGGQRQRVAIARALILEPKVLLLDEAVSALDVTVQAQILASLDELQRELKLTYVFISHDLAVVRQIADTVTVMHKGQAVDTGKVEDVFTGPSSPYTRALIDAIPGHSLRPQTAQALQERTLAHA